MLESTKMKTVFSIKHERITTQAKFLMVSLCLQLRLSHILETANYTEYYKVPFVILFLFFHVLFATPMCFSQILLGQYSRKSQIEFWEIAPIVSGLGYTMLIITIVFVLTDFQIAEIAVVFIYHSMVHSNLPWCDCTFSNGSAHCIDKRNVSSKTWLPHPTRDGEYIMCTGQFQSSQLMYFESSEDTIWGKPYFTLILWIIVYLVAIARLSILIWVVPVMLGIFGSFTAAAVVGSYFYLHKESEYLSHAAPENFGKLDMWGHTALISMSSLNGHTGVMILLGSFNYSRSRPERTAIILSIIRFCSSTMIAFCLILVRQHEEQTYKIKETNSRGCFSGVDGTGNFVPLLMTFICNMPVSRLFSIVIFTAIAFNQIMYVSLEIWAILCSIIDAFPKLLRFRLLVLAGICLLPLCVEAVMSRYDHLQYRNLLHSLDDNTSSVLAVLHTLFVNIIYGSQRLINNMEYLFNVRTERRWRKMWLTNFLLTLTTLYPVYIRFVHDYADNESWTKGQIVIFFLIFSPAIIMAIIMFMRYLRMNALLKLFRPTANWCHEHFLGSGMDESSRVIFYKTPLMRCQHSCLIKNENIEKERKKLEILRVYYRQDLY